MKISVTFRHMESSDAIRSRIELQCHHLEKFLLKPAEVHVILSVEKFRHRAEIIINDQTHSAQASEVSDDLYLSIDRAIAKVEVQMQKHKEKIQEHHKHHSSVQETSALAEKEYLASLETA